MNTHAEYHRHLQPSSLNPEPAGAEEERHLGIHGDPSLSASPLIGPTTATGRRIAWVRPTEFHAYADHMVGRGIDLQAELSRRVRRAPLTATRFGSPSHPRPQPPKPERPAPHPRRNRVMTTYASAEGLRRLLIRLNDAGPGAWRTDPDAADLMGFTIQKYRSLAAKHHCQPEDSASAAFEALRTSAVRTADDPWAVVTRAVQVTLIAEERSNALLCSVGQARRPHISCHHDARRFSEYDTDIVEYHPALCPSYEARTNLPPAPKSTAQKPPTTARQAVDLTIALFVALGWPLNTTTCALDYVAARMVECGSRGTTHAMLRRDHSARALLDLDRRAWSTILRYTLGNPHPDHQFTSTGRGVLLRLMIGDPIIEMLADDTLVTDIKRSAPPVARTADEDPGPAEGEAGEATHESGQVA